MVYVTSMPIHELVIEYYLSLLPGVIPSHARARLTLVAVGDSSPAPLVDKLWSAPDCWPGSRRSCPTPRARTSFRTTARHGSVTYPPARDPHVCRRPRLYRWAPRPDAAGSSPRPASPPLRCRGPPQRRRPRRRRPGPARGQTAARWAMVKLNEGVSGSGNALVGLAGLPAGPRVRDLGTTARCVPRSPNGCAGCSSRTSASTSTPTCAGSRSGAGSSRNASSATSVRSPSVQLRVTPLGELEILSTHDQILGGPTGQSYLGARFPADPAYARPSPQRGEGRSGSRRQRGPRAFRPRLFVVVRRGTDWQTQAIEINLRRAARRIPS